MYWNLLYKITSSINNNFGPVLIQMKTDVLPFNGEGSDCENTGVGRHFGYHGPRDTEHLTKYPGVSFPDRVHLRGQTHHQHQQVRDRQVK